MKDIQPELNPASTLYQGASGLEYHEHKRALHPQALAWVTALRAEKFQAHVQPDDVVLEYGVGSGWNLAGLRCARRIGCDAAEFLKDRITAWGIEFIRDTTTLPDGIVDVLICHHTLEHVLEPAAMLKEFKRLLKPGGKLILHVPWEREKKYRDFRADEPNHHLYNWNAQNLGKLVTVSGYHIERIQTRRYGYDRFAANLAVRLHLGQSGFRLIRSCMIGLRPLQEVEVVAKR